jgi:hypothetical protein
MSRKQSSSWETNSSSFSEVISNLLWDLNVYYRDYTSLRHETFLSQMERVHDVKTYPSKITFRVAHAIVYISLKFFFHSRLSTITLYAFLISHICGNKIKNTYKNFFFIKLHNFAWSETINWIIFSAWQWLSNSCIGKVIVSLEDNE